MLRLRRGLVTLFVRPHRTTLLLRHNRRCRYWLPLLLESVDLPLKPTERVGKGEDGRFDAIELLGHLAQALAARLMLLWR